MSLFLAVMSHPGANHRIEAHFPYYVNSGADKIMGIGTTDGGCKWPEGFESVSIGRNSYIEGPVLPQKLIDTMRFMLLLPYDRFCIIEWDCLFFKPLPAFTGMAAFHAGNQLPGMQTKRFYHVPWCFDYESGQAFLKEGQRMLDAGMVKAGMHEASPDVFFGWVCERSGLLVSQPWEGFSRNTIETAQDAEGARSAVLAGAMAVHGVKSRSSLDYITA